MSSVALRFEPGAFTMAHWRAEDCSFEGGFLFSNGATLTMPSGTNDVLVEFFNMFIKGSGNAFPVHGFFSSNATLRLRGNTFDAPSGGTAFFVILTPGLLDHDGSNQYLGLGTITVTAQTSSTGHYFVLNGSSIGTLSWTRASSTTGINETIHIVNTTVSNAVTLTPRMEMSTIILERVSVNAAVIIDGSSPGLVDSRVELRDVTAASFTTAGTFTRTPLVLGGGTITGIALGGAFTDLPLNLTALQCDVAGVSAALSNVVASLVSVISLRIDWTGATTGGGQILLRNVSVTSVSRALNFAPTAFTMTYMRVEDSTFRMTGAFGGPDVTAVLWQVPPSTTHVLVEFINSTMIGHNAFTAPTASATMGINATLVMRGNTFHARYTSVFSLNVYLSDGRLDHDGSNRHTQGIVSVTVTKSTVGNSFVLNGSRVGAVTWARAASTTGTNETIYIVDTTVFDTMDVLPEIRITPRMASGGTIILERVSSAGPVVINGATTGLVDSRVEPPLVLGGGTITGITLGGVFTDLPLNLTAVTVTANVSVAATQNTVSTSLAHVAARRITWTGATTGGQVLLRNVTASSATAVTAFDFAPAALEMTYVRVEDSSFRTTSAGGTGMAWNASSASHAVIEWVNTHIEGDSGFAAGSLARSARTNATVAANGTALLLSNAMVLTNVTLWMRRNTFKARGAAAPSYVFLVNVSGGRLDHDGSNRYEHGIVHISAQASSSDNYFVLGGSNVASFTWARAASTTGTNETIHILDTTVVGDIRVDGSTPGLVDGRVELDNVTATSFTTAGTFTRTPLVLGGGTITGITLGGAFTDLPLNLKAVTVITNVTVSATLNNVCSLLYEIVAEQIAWTAATTGGQVLLRNVTASSATALTAFEFAPAALTMTYVRVEDSSFRTTSAGGTGVAWNASSASHTVIEWVNTHSEGDSGFAAGNVLEPMVLTNVTLWMRRNTFKARGAAASSYVFLVNTNGGRLDHDSSNRHEHGIVHISAQASSAGTFFVLGGSNVTSFTWARAASTTGTNETIRILDTTVAGAITLTPRTATSTIALERVATQGTIAIDLAAVGSNEVSLVEVSSANNNVNIGGALAAGSFTLRHWSSSAGRLSVALDACSHCVIDIWNASISAAAGSTFPGIEFTTFSANMHVQVRQTSVTTASGTGEAVLFSAVPADASSSVSIVDSTFTTSAAGVAAVRFGASVGAAGFVELWGNTLVSGGLELPLLSTATKAVLVQNKVPGFAGVTGMAPATAGFRRAACNMDASNAPVVISTVGFSTDPCTASSLMPRCGGDLASAAANVMSSVIVPCVAVSSPAAVAAGGDSPAAAVALCALDKTPETTTPTTTSTTTTTTTTTTVTTTEATTTTPTDVTTATSNTTTTTTTTTSTIVPSTTTPSTTTTTNGTATPPPPPTTTTAASHIHSPCGTSPPLDPPAVTVQDTTMADGTVFEVRLASSLPAAATDAALSTTNASISGNGTHMAASPFFWSVTSAGAEPFGLGMLLTAATGGVTCVYDGGGGMLSVSCTVAGGRGFFISQTQTAALMLPTHCGGQVLHIMALTVLKTNPAASATAVDAVTMAGAGASLFLLLCEGTSVEVQAMIVALRSACGTAADHEGTRVARYFLSPFISLGPAWTVIGNVALAGTFAALHAAATFVVARCLKRVPVAAALGPMRFPSVPLTVATLLYMGVAVGTVELLVGRAAVTGAVEVSAALRGVAAAVGIVYLMAVPMAVLTTVFVLAPRLWAATKFETSAHREQYLARRKPLRWLYPHGQWAPEARRRALQSASGPYDGRSRLWAVFPHAVGVAVAVLVGAGTPAAGGLDCLTARILLLVALVAASAGVGLWRPYRAAITTLLTALCFVWLVLVVIALAVLGRAPTVAAERLKVAAIVLLIVTVLLRSLHQFGVMVLRLDTSVLSPAGQTTETQLSEVSGAGEKGKKYGCEKELSVLTNGHFVCDADLVGTVELTTHELEVVKELAQQGQGKEGEGERCQSGRATPDWAENDDAVLMLDDDDDGKDNTRLRSDSKKSHVSAGECSSTSSVLLEVPIRGPPPAPPQTSARSDVSTASAAGSESSSGDALL